MLLPKHFIYSLCLVFLAAISSLGAAAPRELLLKLQQAVKEGRLDAAQRDLQAAIALYPAEAVLYNLLGAVEAQQENDVAAESSFTKAVQLAPDFVGALLNLGRLYQNRDGRDPHALSKAIEAYEKVLHFEPDNLDVLYQSALLLALAGSFEESIEHLDRLPAEARRHASVTAVLCADHAALGHRESASNSADELLRNPNLTGMDVEPILRVVEMHDEPLAIKLLSGLEMRKLASGVQLARLGRLYERTGDPPRAREALDRAVTEGAPVFDTLSELARIAYRQKDREGALRYLAHARDIEPRNAGVHFFFGLVCVELDLPLEARKSLEESVRLDPDNAYFNYALGAVAVNGRNPAEALPYFEKYVASKRDDPRGRFALGAAHFYSANYNAARQELRAVALRPETAAGSHYFLGRIAKQEQDLSTAESELEQAVAANPVFPDALAELAHIHIRLEKYESARHELERAAAIEPDNFRVNANLLILYQRTKDPRAAAQQARFDEIGKKRSENEALLWRTIEVRPY